MKTNIKNIIVGVSGGIAAYKIPFLVRGLRKRGYNVKVVLTRSAEGMVGADALRTVSANPVYQDVVGEFDMGHIRLEEWADLLLIAPATGNTIAKLAHGVADNLLSTLALAVSCPIAIVPAMNTNMWDKPATQDNLVALRERGVTILPVGSGELACGVVGAGRMIEPDDIVSYVPILGTSRSLEGKRVLVASGPTEEALDPVRVLTNKSSGQMGAALARAALIMGAEVTVVSGPSVTPLPQSVCVKSVKTALEMQEALVGELDDADYIIMAAAVSDYRVEYSEEKLNRVEGEEVTLKLIANPDIAASLGFQKKPHQKLVTFSLETEAGLERAQEKMARKGADLTVYNQVSKSLGKRDAEQVLLFPDGTSEKLESADKAVQAVRILGALK